MDKEYVVEGNKLLAHYMGYEYIPHNNSYGWKPGWWKRTVHPRFRYPEMQGTLHKTASDWYLCRNHNELRYYNEWNWLMKVLDKLEKEGYNSAIKTNYARLNPIEGNYYHYITMVRWGESSYVVDTNPDDNSKVGLVEPIFGALETITKLQAVFIMLVEGIKIIYPEIIEKIKL